MFEYLEKRQDQTHKTGNKTQKIVFIAKIRIEDKTISLKPDEMFTHNILCTQCT